MTLAPILPQWFLVSGFALLGGFAVWQLVVNRHSRRVIDWSGRVILVLLLFAIALRPSIPATVPGASVSGGLEVYFAIDTTSSMAAEDYGTPVTTAEGNRPGNRLDGVKADVAAITDALAGAQFSLVTFDSSAIQRVPLTSDGSAVKSAASVLTQEVTAFSSGSSIDEPLALLKNLLATANTENPARPRVLFYFGDGEQTSSAIPRSFNALAPYLRGGAVLGYGTDGGGRMRQFDGRPRDPAAPATAPSYIQDTTKAPVVDAVSHIDETSLRLIATQLGVGYVHRSSGDSIDSVVAGIGVGQATTTSEPPGKPTEFYWIFAIPAGLILIREIFGLVGEFRSLSPRTTRRGRGAK